MFTKNMSDEELYQELNKYDWYCDVVGVKVNKDGKIVLDCGGTGSILMCTGRCGNKECTCNDDAYELMRKIEDTIEKSDKYWLTTWSGFDYYEVEICFA